MSSVSLTSLSLLLIINSGDFSLVISYPILVSRILFGKDGCDGVVIPLFQTSSLVLITVLVAYHPWSMKFSNL